jgi:hypothetical protein
MARFPLRALGLVLLTVTLFGASCQAVFAGAAALSTLQTDGWQVDHG